MAATLLDNLTGLITPTLTGQAASMLGESDTGIRKGMFGALPLLLSGVANRSREPAFASSLFDLARSPDNDGSVLNNIGSLLGANSSSAPMSLGNRLLGSLFGGNTGGVTNALSSYAGIKSSTAATLMNLAAPLLLAAIGRRVRNDGLNASSLATLLAGERETYAAALPGALANVTGPVVETRDRDRDYYAARPAAVPERKSSIWRWMVPAVIALGLIWLLSSLLGRGDRPATETVRAPAITAPTPAPVTAPATVAAAPAIPAANVYFDVDQSALPAGSQATLAPIVTYLRANPGATADVSGYHDPTGDRATNEALARNRAASVKAALVAAGVPESQVNMDRPLVTAGGGSLQDARRVEVTVR